MKRSRPPGVRTPEESELFRAAVRDVTPIRSVARVTHHSTPPPVPVQSMLDAQQALAESRIGPIPWDQSMETGEELVYLRDGLARDVLRKLRRGHWTIQQEIDLHGLNRDQAREALADFLHECRRTRQRCVRVVHGKGLRSPGREPVIKREIRSWLSRRDDVLAFCQAPSGWGGGGALLILLKAEPQVRSRLR